MPTERIKWLEYEFARLLRFMETNLSVHDERQNVDSIGLDKMSLPISLYGPQTDIQVAFRAVYYEAASILENELQLIAYRVAIPKQNPESSELHGDSDKTIGIKYGECCDRIEKALRLKLSALPGAETVSQLREVVNSFKHRKGLVDKNPSNSGMCIPLRHNINTADVRKSIDHTQQFLSALHNATGFKW